MYVRCLRTLSELTVVNYRVTFGWPFFIYGHYRVHRNMKIFTDTPLITKEALEYLKRQFPDSLPKGQACTVEQLRYLQGQQSVIEKIRQLTEFPEDEET